MRILNIEVAEHSLECLLDFQLHVKHKTSLKKIKFSAVITVIQYISLLF